MAGGSSEAADPGGGAGDHGSGEGERVCGAVWRDGEWENHTGASVPV